MFCVQVCREEWHRAKRDYLQDKLASGVISVEVIKAHALEHATSLPTANT
jgi:hypothetical protein